ncbi:MAG TPA: hypothetical protein VHP35_00155 [Terriglobia bacterium]|nr:hypothetical protein [Terriglobia bacterium]
MNLVEGVENRVFLRLILDFLDKSKLDKLVPCGLDLPHGDSRAYGASTRFNWTICREDRMQAAVAGSVDIRHVVAGHLQGELMRVQGLSSDVETCKQASHF